MIEKKNKFVNLFSICEFIFNLFESKFCILQIKNLLISIYFYESVDNLLQTIIFFKYMFF